MNLRYYLPRMNRSSFPSICGFPMLAAFGWCDTQRYIIPRHRRSQKAFIEMAHTGAAPG